MRLKLRGSDIEEGAREMRALHLIAYSTLAGLLLGYAFISHDVRVASADTPGSPTISGPVADYGGATVAAVPDDTGTAMSYYATSPYYNPYYNYYSYYNPYYNPYYNAYYNAYQNYYNYYYNYHYYPSYYYYGGSQGSYTYCTIPGGGSVWIAYGQSTAGLICN
jgi:hypothetical protein